MVRKVQGQIIVPSPVHEIPEGYRLFNFILLLKVSFVKLYIHFFLYFYTTYTFKVSALGS